MSPGRKGTRVGLVLKLRTRSNLCHFRGEAELPGGI